MEITKIIRKICKDFKPYVAGKSINAIKREFGLESVIKLASNENPLGASKKALEAIKSNLENIFFTQIQILITLKRHYLKHIIYQLRIFLHLQVEMK